MTSPAAASGRPQGEDKGKGGHGHGHGHGHGRREQVPHDRISIQLYTLRSAAADPSPTAPAAIGYLATLQAVARYGYERVELAGLYGQTAAGLRTTLDGLGMRAPSSHGGISADWQRWADQMNAEAAVAKGYGLNYG